MEAFMAQSLADFSAAQAATAKHRKTTENNFFIFDSFQVEFEPETGRSQRRSGQKERPRRLLEKLLQTSQQWLLNDPAQAAAIAPFGIASLGRPSSA
jgi:hypothetical protein